MKHSVLFLGVGWICTSVEYVAKLQNAVSLLISQANDEADEEEDGDGYGYGYPSPQGKLFP